jgi:hypothetical protein
VHHVVQVVGAADRCQHGLRVQLGAQHDHAEAVGVDLGNQRGPVPPTGLVQVVQVGGVADHGLAGRQDKAWRLRQDRPAFLAEDGHQGVTPRPILAGWRAAEKLRLAAQVGQQRNRTVSEQAHLERQGEAQENLGCRHARVNSLPLGSLRRHRGRQHARHADAGQHR